MSEIYIKFKDYDYDIFKELKEKFGAKIDFNDLTCTTLFVPLRRAEEWSKLIPQETKLFFKENHVTQPLLQFMGFKVVFPIDIFVEKMFDEFMDLDRSKQNYFLLQEKLINAGLKYAPEFNDRYIKEINLLYPIAKRNNF